MAIKELINEWNQKLESHNRKAVASLYLPTRNLVDVIQLLNGADILYLEATGSTPSRETYTKIDVPIDRSDGRIAIYEAVEANRKRGWIRIKEPSIKDVQIALHSAEKHNIKFRIAKLIIKSKLLGPIEFEMHAAKEGSPLGPDTKIQRFLKGLKTRGDRWQSLDVAFHDPEKLEILQKEMHELTLRICSVSKSQVVKYDTECIIPDVKRQGKSQKEVEAK